MKTQKIINVNPQGYCGGVLKAISIAKQTRQEHPHEKVTILGNLVHNTFVKKALAFYNIETIEDNTKTRLQLLDDIQEGIVIFTAHGVSPQVRQKALAKNLTCIDASCPFVLQTQKIVQKHLQEGYTIFYIGKNKHPEAESIYTLSNQVYLIQSIQDIPKIHNDKIFVTNQTTMSILDIQQIFQTIKEIYPHAIIHDEICNATRVRQEAILKLKDIDCLIVVGDPTSNNTQKLAQIGKLANIAHIYKIQSVEDLNKKDFNDFTTIAITSGASTPTYLRQQIYDYLQNDIEKPKIRIQDIL